MYRDIRQWREIRRRILDERGTEKAGVRRDRDKPETITDART